MVTETLYALFIRLYQAAIFFASWINPKASLWRQGRKNWQLKLSTALGSNTLPIIWMHCASLGEFEQGRPVLETLKNQHPQFKFLLTFFSPSGYEVRKNYEQADWVFYLPLDTAQAAQNFVATVKPSLAIFVKYEYWYHYLHTLHQKDIPTVLISARFVKEAIFFKWYGMLQRKMLHFFSHIFVQDLESKSLLISIIPPAKVTIAGDTRFDRVTQIVQNFTPIAPLEKLLPSQSFIVVAGSTWPTDESLLQKMLLLNDASTLLIIAPHEINPSHIQYIKTIFPNHTLYSNLLKSGGNEKLQKVLIIDNIGLLSRLYYYADLCYIGGGFNKSGIHNTLEAAVYGKPIIFGPNFQKFAEANELIKIGGSLSYSTQEQLNTIFNKIKTNKSYRQEMGQKSGRMVLESKGATQVICEYIQENLR